MVGRVLGRGQEAVNNGLRGRDIGVSDAEGDDVDPRGPLAAMIREISTKG